MIRKVAQPSANTFIAQQKQESGEALLTLVQFDTDYEFVHSREHQSTISLLTKNVRQCFDGLRFLERFRYPQHSAAVAPEVDNPDCLVAAGATHHFICRNCLADLRAVR